MQVYFSLWISEIFLNTSEIVKFKKVSNSGKVYYVFLFDNDLNHYG